MTLREAKAKALHEEYVQWRQEQGFPQFGDRWRIMRWVEQANLWGVAFTPWLEKE